MDRTFVQMELLKTIYAEAKFPGIHILKRYDFFNAFWHNFFTLLKIFDQFYQEFLTAAPSAMLTKEQCFLFVNR